MVMQVPSRRNVAAIVAALALLASMLPASLATAGQPDPRLFEQTGYRIDNDAFWDYFQRRGGARSFGLPVSRALPMLGCTTQFFQRLVMQRCGDAGVGTLNLLDEGLLPYTSFNGSVVPAPDAALKLATPRPGDPEYGSKVVDFVRKNAPDMFEGEPVRFGQTFFETLSPAAAGTNDPNLLGLLDLEIWGAPTSLPARDPGNGGFIYQRFQRGIMHYDRACGCTQGLLLADYLKAVITGENLPGDLEAQARSSPLYRSAVDRPAPDATDFDGAFFGVVRVGGVQVGAPTNTPTPVAALPTNTPTALPINVPTATSVAAKDPLLGDLNSQLAFQEPIGSGCSAQPGAKISITASAEVVEFPDVPTVCIAPVANSTAAITVTLKRLTQVIRTDTLRRDNLASGWQWVTESTEPPAPGVTYTLEASQGSSKDSTDVFIKPAAQPRVVIYPRRGQPGTTFRIFLAKFQANEKVLLRLYRCDRGSACQDDPNSNPLTYAAPLGPVQTSSSGEGVYRLTTTSAAPARLYVVYPDALVKSQASIFVGDLGKPWVCLTTGSSCKTEYGVN
jgi:hypothetical protein